ncbi:hypothetical protein EDD16DRAFT_1707684 [Pisolithus croceorrhizus]|nr:hypothetical protein EDD16DRAFT_1707684 [Pisolithus croceorrhizus]
MGDEQVGSDPLDSVNANTDDIIAAAIVKGSRGTTSLTPSTQILNVVDDIIHIEVTASLSKWDMHFFSVNIQSPGIKKIVLCLKDTGNSILSPGRKHALEEEALEQVEEASSKLQAAHAALWKAYEGTIGIQDMFTRVTDVSARLDAIHNKLSLLRDANDSLEMELVKVEDVDIKPKPAEESEKLTAGVGSDDLRGESTSKGASKAWGEMLSGEHLMLSQTV